MVKFVTAAFLIPFIFNAIPGLAAPQQGNNGAPDFGTVNNNGGQQQKGLPNGSQCNGVGTCLSGCCSQASGLCVDPESSSSVCVFTSGSFQGGK